MTDKFPNVNSQAVESAARLHDVQERARAASPVSTHGKDILREGWGGLRKDEHGRLATNPNFGLPLINH